MTDRPDLATYLAGARARIRQGEGARATLELRELICRYGLAAEEILPAANVIRESSQAPESAPPELRTARLAVLGGYTTHPVIAAARCALLAEGVLASVYEAPFDAYFQEAFDPRSGLHEFRPEYALVAVGSCNVRRWPAASAAARSVEEALELEVADYGQFWSALEQMGVGAIYQHTFETPVASYLGPAEAGLAGSPAAFVRELRNRLAVSAPPQLCWVDVDELAARVGRRNWFDPRLYYQAKVGFSPRHLREYLELLRICWRAGHGHGKKCLVLDLDNTLWGGAIGDDGLEGIRLGPGTPEGEAWFDFCKYVQGLGQRGVILAVCSKNDPELASEVFRSHRSMPLRLEDFASFQCNWEDKASNLRRIAAELNIALDSIVFADDNPAECAQVEGEIPEVTVVRLPEDPSCLVSSLDELGLFASRRLSREDLGRTASYASRREAEQLRSRAPDLGTFLERLEMKATFRAGSRSDVTRVAQMHAKTNQFNPTTRRFGVAEIEGYLASPEQVFYVTELEDRFARHGLVSTILGTVKGGDLFIESWLMSCRVFSRTLEHFMFNRFRETSALRGLRNIVGEYVPTKANSVVAGLYPGLGFTPAEGPGGRWWKLAASGQTALRTFVRELPGPSELEVDEGSAGPAEEDRQHQ